jgi:CRISPR-associated protein Csd1
MLNQIAAYAFRQFSGMEPGFGPVSAKWRISILSDSSLVIEPFGGEHGGELTRCPEFPENLLQGGGKSNFLVDTLQVMLLYLDDKKDDAEKYDAKHRYFVDLIGKAEKENKITELLSAASFFSNPDGLTAARARLAELGAKPTDKAFFRVGEFDPLQDERCQDWWKTFRRQMLGSSVKKPKSMVCLLSGETIIPAQTHPKISGLKNVGGRGQDIVVGCDKDAFKSYKLEQAENGAMSETMANAYAKGMDDLIARHSKTLAGAKVVHWFKEQVRPQVDVLEWLNDFESQEQTEASAQRAAHRLLESIRSGERSDLGDNHYYALTLSGASGRVMVRDWMEGRFEDLVSNVEAWFADFAIVVAGDRKDCDGKKLARDPKFYEVCLALVRNDQKKSISENLKQLPAPNAAILWKVAVQRLPIPQPLMAQALARFRADLVDKDAPPLNHARMGLIKAYFVRLKPGGDTTMTAYLNPDHPEPAYHCGRLMAVLAELQYAALGDVGAGVVQRYYASASQMPGLILGRLVRNAQFHLNKPDKPWLGSKFEKPMMEIVGNLKDGFPQTLNLEGQGLFALGYYQQLAALRAGKKTDETTQGEKQ